MKEIYSWKEIKPAFIDKIVDLTYKHFPEKIVPCPDCGKMAYHVCETALRMQLDVYFEKVYQWSKDEKLTD